jgi:hypothetical protein
MIELSWTQAPAKLIVGASLLAIIQPLADLDCSVGEHARTWDCPSCYQRNEVCELPGGF